MKYRIEFEAKPGDKCPVAKDRLMGADGQVNVCGVKNVICVPLGHPGCPAVAVAKCKWKYDKGEPFLRREGWETECGKCHHDYNYKFCPYCGREIEVCK